ncbi:MAG TPA: hypothetical protein H9769_11635 [Candidatus Microbacterium pullistercoris]|nr:hypothetical protein [Candidatus Microbacterium pullistercoris]
MTARRALLGIGAAVAVTFALTACTGSAAPDEGAAPSEPTSASGPMTCETILRPSFAEQLAELGWSAQQSPFRIGEHELAEGIQCVWGDAAHATDVAQMYGWAPVAPEQTAELQQYLEDNGWLREEDGDVVYLTEDPDVVGYLEEGEYGMTYQFASGWVALADTKESLDLITWRG